MKKSFVALLLSLSFLSLPHSALADPTREGFYAGTSFRNKAINLSLTLITSTGAGVLLLAGLFVPLTTGPSISLDCPNYTPDLRIEADSSCLFDEPRKCIFTDFTCVDTKTGSRAPAIKTYNPAYYSIFAGAGVTLLGGLGLIGYNLIYKNLAQPYKGN